jgi:hypothetical protein
MLGLAQLAALIFAAGQFDLSGTVIAETRAGAAPTTAGAASEASVLGILTPAVDLLYLSPRLELRLDYALRIFWRETDQDASGIPVYLHTGTITASARATRRLRLSGTLQVSEGAADYSYLPILVGTNQATLVSVPQIFVATARAGGELDLSHRTKLQLELNGAYRRSIGDPNAIPPGMVPPTPTGVAPPPTVFPTFTLVSAKPGVAIRLSPVDDLELSSAATYQYASPVSVVPLNGSGVPVNRTVTSLSVTPRVGWRVRTARSDEIRFGAGVAFSHLTGTDAADANPISPVADVAFRGVVVSGRDFVLRTSVGGTVDYFLDPVLGTSGPRGTVSAGLLLTLPSEWTAGLDGNFSTTLTSHPTIASAAMPTPVYPDETSAAVVVPVRHRISDSLFMEIGARWSDRGVQIFAPHFGFHAHEYWFYVQLTTTSRQIPRSTML